MGIMDLPTLWNQMLTELRPSLPPQIYSNWFAVALIPYSYENNTLTLDTTTQFVCSFISKKYTPLLEQTATRVLGTPTRVVLINSETMDSPEDLSEPSEAPTITLPPEPPVPPAPPVVRETPPISDTTEWIQTELPAMDSETHHLPPVKQANPAITASALQETLQENNLIDNFTFETFIVGNSNRIAYAAAQAVAEAPAQKFNPFYIYGDSGLGKTHLMHAIGHRILQNFPNMRLRCITSEDFVNEFIQCIQDKNTESFRHRYRNIDILLVDDIQFFGRGDKESSKEEFFHTFNKLFQDHKQMVFTSDRAPQDIKRFEERLRSRFQSGMVVEIATPDLETRIAILKKWAETEQVQMESSAIEYLASNVSENIRVLNGAFNNVIMLSNTEKKPITLELTQQAIRYLIEDKDEKKYITIDEITSAVCQYYNVNYKDLMGKKKTKDIATPRQIAMYLCRELTGNTYPHIGTAFNGRDHTTVMHACTKVTKLIEKDKHFKEGIEKLKNKITGVDN